MAERQTNLSEIPAYETFVKLVAKNIEVLPEVKLDENGIRHRIQIFNEPGTGPRVLFSKRALARYKCCKDVLGYALAKKSPEGLCSAACLLLGKDLLLSNRFAGAALIAHAFTKLRATYMPDEGVFEYMVKGVREDDQAATINFFLPLAHEIGHFERSQALGPTDIHGPKFLDTYRINYEQIRPILGDLDYPACQNSAESPLYLPLLREEVISDWFAVNAVIYLVCRRSQNSQFDMTEAFSSLIMFPLVAAFEQTCLKEWRSTQFVQEILLATQCRYSILIDSMRATTKNIFPHAHADIDQALSEIDEQYGESLRTIWKAATQFISITRELMKLSDVQIGEYMRREVPSSQWLEFHAYLAAILEDSKGYPLFESNRVALRKVFDSMITFDTVVITDDGVIGIPRRSGTS